MYALCVDKRAGMMNCLACKQYIQKNLCVSCLLSSFEFHTNKFFIVRVNGYQLPLPIAFEGFPDQKKLRKLMKLKILCAVHVYRTHSAILL